jgi:hypothetical protein
MVRTTKTERDESLARLREWIKRGDTVYTILRGVSRSGMQRRISLVLLKRDENDAGRIIDLHPNWAASKVLGYRLDRSGSSDALIVGGCGMDMGFHLVYSLAAALFDGDGYALNHRWL